MIIHGNCLDELKKLEDSSVDLVCTDPPYGYSFMGKDWDKAVPSVEIWQECLRVLKPGAFAFVMSAPRSDVLSRMIVRLEDAGFRVDFSPLYWTYASGFPKALHVAKNIGKIADEVCELFTNASTAIASLNDTPVNTKAGVRIVVQGVEVSPKQLSFNVLAELPSEYQGAFTSRLINITVPATALIEECERALSKIKGGVPSKTELGSPKFWRLVDFDALCVELIDGWKHIIFSKLETDPTFATTSQTECAFVTPVTITASTMEHLISSTADMLARKLGGAREITSVRTDGAGNGTSENVMFDADHRFVATKVFNETKGHSQLEGSYGGFQPKPAVEVIIVAMKPLSEKTYVDQALVNGKGISWLDDCRVPPADNDRQEYGRGSELPNANTTNSLGKFAVNTPYERPEAGRFPANLLVSDDILNDHSRFFSLDKWADTLPFLAVPKASKREKDEGLEGFEEKMRSGANKMMGDAGPMKTGSGNDRTTHFKNNHPTVKPLKLMHYLITLGSREGDTVLDPFVGSGTTAVAAQKLNRRPIGIEREQEYVDIAVARLNTVEKTLFA